MVDSTLAVSIKLKKEKKGGGGGGRLVTVGRSAAEVSHFDEVVGG